MAMFPLYDSVKAKKFPFVNLTFIFANIYVFYLEMTARNTDAFINYFALTPAHVSMYDPMTWVPFVTSMFLHGGILHILSNMWFLWIFGDNVEGEIGHVGYAFLYLVSGIIGGVTQFLLMPNSTVPMLGASGAVAGALGAYLMLFPHHKIKTVLPIVIFLTVVEVSAIVMLGYWFILQIISVFLVNTNPMEGGVAFWAHIGGFLAGMLIGKIFASANRAVEGEVVS